MKFRAGSRMAAAPRNFPCDERGLSLTELAIVGVLATLVMVGLTTFYFNSQRMWIDGSMQAIAQRDATLLVEKIRGRVHEAQAAVVTPKDANHDQLTLQYAGGTPAVDILWDPDDGRIHEWVGGADAGAIVESQARQFKLTTLGPRAVELTVLEMRSAVGDTVKLSSRFALFGGN